jgi:carbonic anhydrase/acetyltransferase-like protein (isoleucine patch superfamily)
MKHAVIMQYQGVTPQIGAGAQLSPWAAAIGRLRAGDRLTLRAFATLRADGEDIDVGNDCWFGERATVHIADLALSSKVGNRITVGRFAIVHACTVDDYCVIGDGAVVMDDAVIGRGAVIAAFALVPPRKRLEGGWLYSGSPAEPIRRVEQEELEQLRQQLIIGAKNAIVCSTELPPLHAQYPVPGTRGEAPPLYELRGRSPEIHADAYVAPTAMLAGRVFLEKDASVWFGTALIGSTADIRIGERTNIQDNCIIDAQRGSVTFGNDVTLGHNVRMGAAHVEDECLIGIGSIVGEGTVVERGGCVAAGAAVPPNTVVKAGYIWAGRPAREFRPLKPEERELFRRGKEAYIRYAHTYPRHVSN